MNIVIENTVVLNTGDAAIMLALRQILKSVTDEELSFTVFDSQPDVATRLYPPDRYPDIQFRRLLSEVIFKYGYGGAPVKNLIKRGYNKLVEAALARYDKSRHLFNLPLSGTVRRSLDCYRNADLVLTTGGTYLVETYNLEKRINQFAIDKLLGKSPVFFTQSLGPFEKPFNRRRLKPIIEASPLVLLRDEASLRNVAELVDDTSRCSVVADSVFALADLTRIEAALASGLARPNGRVAVSVRQWDYVEGGAEGMRRYIDAIQALVTALVRDHGKKVTFLSTCQGVPEYAHDDSRTARAIVAELDSDVAGNVGVDADFHTPEELMALVADFDFVISTRMHMMIMALCVGTPVLPIAYEFKTRELAKRTGVADLLLDIDSMTPEEALSKLDRFTTDFARYRADSLEAVLREHASAMRAGELIKPLLEAHSPDGPKEITGIVHQRVA